MHESREWVPVAPPLIPSQAEVLRGVLEAQGIPVHLSGGGLSQALGLGLGPLGSVQVLVPGDRLHEAQAIAEAFFRGDLEAPQG